MNCLFEKHESSMFYYSKHISASVSMVLKQHLLGYSMSEMCRTYTLVILFFFAVGTGVRVVRFCTVFKLRRQEPYLYLLYWLRSISRAQRKFAFASTHLPSQIHPVSLPLWLPTMHHVMTGMQSAVKSNTATSGVT